jgi:Ni,Fe-hydrogenase III large subunit/Ni,Fe-hydrogenase III component G
VSGPLDIGLRNRRTVPWSAVPRESPGAFVATVTEAVRDGWRLVSLFGMPEDDDQVCLAAIVAEDRAGTLAATSAIVRGEYAALSRHCPQAERFEREIAEQCGVTPTGHPDLRPLRRHPPDHAPAGTPARAVDRDALVFSRIEGEDVHEVAVGPVHAGIIEPGHFRFQAYGEEVLALDVALGYQHRGVERLIETLDPTRAVLVAESIAGDTVIGHAEAFCGAREALGRSPKTPRAQFIRGIALELERLANHIGDLGAMAGDVAYQPAAAYLGRLRGDCLNLLMTISGNRYGRGFVRPGGVAFDLPDAMADDVRERLERVREELTAVLPLMFDNASVQARFEGVGVVPRAAAEQLGFVGPVARACEIGRDVRHDHPYGVFRFAHVPVATAWAGDVLARALVRRLEIQRSLDFAIQQLGALPRGAVRVPCGALRPNEIVVAMTEGWRGEIVHVVITDADGHIRRHKVTDPSFHNWTALPLALPGNQISDFPLCNKSFNLSYAGHDL